jgi:hypothetical protein
MDRFRMLPSYHYEDNIDGNLLKSVGKPLRDYKIEGNCFQDGTPSPGNPIDIQCCGEKTVNLIENVIVDKITTTSYETYENGVKTTSKNNGAYLNYISLQVLPLDVLEWGQTYTFSCFVKCSHNDMNPLFRIGYSRNTTNAFVDLATYKRPTNNSVNSITVTLPSEPPSDFGRSSSGYGSDYILLFMNVQRENYDKYYGTMWITDIMVQKGNTATPYEPYGYKVPVTVGGKNLFDKSLSPLYGIKAETAINYYGAVFYDNACTISMLKPDTTYTVSFECECTENVSADVTLTSDRLGFMLYSGISGYSGIPLWTDKAMTAGEKLTHHATFTTPSNLHDLAANYRLILYGNNYHDSNGVSTKPFIIWRNIKFQEGTPKTYNIYLDEPLRKVGDYADYVDFKNGKVVKEITAKVEFTGDENWVIYPNKTKTFQYIPSLGIMLKGICSHYSSIKSSSMDIENGFVMEYIRSFIISDVRYNTVDDFKAFLKSEYENGKPVTFYIKINAKTIETEITLPQILTEKYTNIISVGTTLQPNKVNYQYYKGGK